LERIINRNENKVIVTLNKEGEREEMFVGG